MDHVSVNELPKPGGMDRYSAQPYELKVEPTGGRERPELDFLHKGDGITVDGTGYIVEFAQQILAEDAHEYWTWVYRAIKDRSGEHEERDNEWKGW